MAEGTAANNPTLVLASGSSYRRDLLSRLRLAFSTISPAIDESPRSNEDPPDLVARLAREKAAAVARVQPDAVVIGSDQAATLDGRLLGKPGTVENAVAQLSDCAGRPVEFLTAVCVFDGRSPRSEALVHLDITRVVFRPLTRGEIERYVSREQPLDCAGGFKSEGLGIALFDRIDSQDPTGLVGLPLIWLSKALIQIGFKLL
jgi:septum formation protein